MSKYNGFKREDLESQLVEKLFHFLKYLYGQSSYPMGKYPTGIYSPNGGEYLIWIGCSVGTVAFTLQDTKGVDYHNIEMVKFGGSRPVLNLASRPLKENGSILFAKSYSMRCDVDQFESSPTFFLKQLLPKIRKKDQVLAFLVGLERIVESNKLN